MNKELLKGPNWSKGLITAVKTVPKCDYNTDYKNNNNNIKKNVRNTMAQASKSKMRRNQKQLTCIRTRSLGCSFRNTKMLVSVLPDSRFLNGSPPLRLCQTMLKPAFALFHRFGLFTRGKLLRMAGTIIHLF